VRIHLDDIFSICRVTLASLTGRERTDWCVLFTITMHSIVRVIITVVKMTLIAKTIILTPLKSTCFGWSFCRVCGDVKTYEALTRLLFEKELKWWCYYNGNWERHVWGYPQSELNLKKSHAIPKLLTFSVILFRGHFSTCFYSFLHRLLPHRSLVGDATEGTAGWFVL